MQSRRTRLVLLLAMPFLMFMAVSGEEAVHGSDAADFIGKVVNFTVLFGGLGVLLYKPLRSFLVARGREIDLMIRRTRESRETAEARLRETERRLDELTAEIDRIRSEAERQGREVKEKILAAAEKEADRLTKLAQREIEMIGQNVQRELRAYAAELATRQARTRLLAKITPERQTRLIDLSIERLERLYEQSGSG